MLIPSLDLQHGAVVQLVQGERLAVKDDDVFRWVRRFASFSKVQVIDLDAAMGKGDNLALVREIAGQLSCRVVKPSIHLRRAGARGSRRNRVARPPERGQSRRQENREQGRRKFCRTSHV